MEAHMDYNAPYLQELEDNVWVARTTPDSVWWKGTDPVGEGTQMCILIKRFQNAMREVEETLEKWEPEILLTDVV